MIITNAQSNFIPVLNVYPQPMYPQFIPAIVSPALPFNLIPQLSNQSYSSFTPQNLNEQSPLPPGLSNENPQLTENHPQVFSKNTQSGNIFLDRFSPVTTHINKINTETQDIEFLSLSHSVFNSIWGETTQVEKNNMMEISIFKEGKILQEEWETLILELLEQDTYNFEQEAIILQNLLKNMRKESRFINYNEDNKSTDDFLYCVDSQNLTEGLDCIKAESNENQEKVENFDSEIKTNEILTNEVNPNKDQFLTDSSETIKEKNIEDENSEKAISDSLEENELLQENTEKSEEKEVLNETEAKSETIEHEENILQKATNKSDQENEMHPQSEEEEEVFKFSSSSILCLNENIDQIIKLNETKKALLLSNDYSCDYEKNFQEAIKAGFLGNNNQICKEEKTENENNEENLKNAESGKRIKKKSNRKKKKAKNENNVSQKAKQADDMVNKKNIVFDDQEDFLKEIIEKSNQQNQDEIFEKESYYDQSPPYALLSDEKISDIYEQKYEYKPITADLGLEIENNLLLKDKNKFNEEDEKENQKDLYLKYKALYENTGKRSDTREIDSKTLKEKEMTPMDKRLESIEKMFESLGEEIHQSANFEDYNYQENFKPAQKLSKHQKKKLRKKRKQESLYMNDYTENTAPPMQEVDSNYLAMLSNVLVEDPFALVKLKELILAQHTNGDFVELGFTEEELQEIEEVNLELEKTMKRTYKLSSSECENNENISSKDDQEKKSKEDTSPDTTTFPIPFSEDLENKLVEPINDEPNVKVIS